MPTDLQRIFRRLPPAGTLAGLLCAVMLASFTASCGKPNGAAGDGVTGDAEPRERIFRVKGVIKRFNLAAKEVIIAHEVIPDYMAAMTMPFHVKDAAELADLDVGDVVSFRYVVLPDDDWIDQVKKVTSTSSAPATDDRGLVPFIEPLAVGDFLPDGAFTNHLGRAVRLEEFRGQAVVLAFFFSRCTAAEVCPRQMVELTAAAQQLAHGPGPGTNCQFVCVTLDPAYDTPEVLQAFALHAGSLPSWQFLTGKPQAVERLADRCGVVVLAHAGTLNHNLRLIVADAQGRVRRIFRGGEWTAGTLATELVQAAAH